MARAFPLYGHTSRKWPSGAVTPAPSPSRNVSVYLRVPKDTWLGVLADLTAAAEGIQLAARLVDTPPNVLHTSAFVEEAMAVARGLGDVAGVTVKVIRGEELAEQGFGGIYGVGKAAVEPPALVVLSHVVRQDGQQSSATGGGKGLVPDSSVRGVPVTSQAGNKSVCFVGKGIVYDTGGLSIKTKTGMVRGFGFGKNAMFVCYVDTMQGPVDACDSPGSCEAMVCSPYEYKYILIPICFCIDGCNSDTPSGVHTVQVAECIWWHSADMSVEFLLCYLLRLKFSFCFPSSGRPDVRPMC